VPQEIEVVDLTALVPNLSWREEADTVTSITRCIGKPLETIAFNEFWHNGIPAPRLDGELEFIFASGEPLKIVTTHMSGVCIRLSVVSARIARESNGMATARTERFGTVVVAGLFRIDRCRRANQS